MKQAVLFTIVFTSIYSFIIINPIKVKALTQIQNNQEQKRLEIQQMIEVRKNELEQKRLELRERERERIESRIASKEARLAERKKERIRNLFAIIMNRYKATVNRLEKLIARIESRIAKLKDEGKDTGDVEEQITKAKNLLEEVKADLAAADETLNDILDSSDPKTEFKVLKDFIYDIKLKLIEIHRILVHTVGDMIGLRVGQYGVSLTVTVTLTPTQEQNQNQL